MLVNTDKLWFVPYKQQNCYFIWEQPVVSNIVCIKDYVILKNASFNEFLEIFGLCLFKAF